MIVLDTNVLSETLRLSVNPGVALWFEEQSPASLFTTAITQAEMLVGIRALTPGKRREALAAAVAGMFDDLAGRVLPFDESAASFYAEILTARRQAGRPISQSDCQIAAITRSHGGRLATRNIRDFTDCGIEVVDPFN